jgi:hypothetical protein
MSSGWETAKSREVGRSDWVVIRLGISGHLNSEERRDNTVLVRDEGKALLVQGGLDLYKSRIEGP